MATARQARTRAAESEQWLTTAQVSEITGFAAKTLTNYRYPGCTIEGPPWHMGPTGKPRYKRAEVLAWMAKTSKQAKPPKPATVAKKVNGAKKRARS